MPTSCAGKPHAAHEQAEALIALATEQGFALFLAIGGILRGGTRTALGQRGEQIGQIRQDLAALRETGSAVWEPYFLGLLAEAYAQEGQVEAGLATLDEALAAQATGQRLVEAELYRLRGGLLLRQTGTPQAEAETWLQRALDVARRQEAKSLELRAAMSLSRLRHQQGKRRRRTTCWLRSTRGSPRALTLPISRRPRRCSRSSRKDGGTYRRVLEGPARRRRAGSVAALRPRSAFTVHVLRSPRLCPSTSHSPGTRAHRATHHSCTGVRMGAPLAFSSTTTNLAGAVVLALRPTT